MNTLTYCRYFLSFCSGRVITRSPTCTPLCYTCATELKYCVFVNTLSCKYWFVWILERGQQSYNVFVQCRIGDSMATRGNNSNIRGTSYHLCVTYKMIGFWLVLHGFGCNIESLAKERKALTKEPWSDVDENFLLSSIHWPRQWNKFPARSVYTVRIATCTPQHMQW